MSIKACQLWCATDAVLRIDTRDVIKAVPEMLSIGPNQKWCAGCPYDPKRSMPVVGVRQMLCLELTGII